MSGRGAILETLGGESRGWAEVDAAPGESEPGRRYRGRRLVSLRLGKREFPWRLDCANHSGVLTDYDFSGSGVNLAACILFLDFAVEVHPLAARAMYMSENCSCGVRRNFNHQKHAMTPTMTVFFKQNVRHIGEIARVNNTVRS